MSRPSGRRGPGGPGGFEQSKDFKGSPEMWRRWQYNRICGAICIYDRKSREYIIFSLPIAARGDIMIDVGYLFSQGNSELSRCWRNRQG